MNKFGKPIVTVKANGKALIVRGEIGGPNLELPIDLLLSRLNHMCVRVRHNMFTMSDTYKVGVHEFVIESDVEADRPGVPVFKIGPYEFDFLAFCGFVIQAMTASSLLPNDPRRGWWDNLDCDRETRFKACPPMLHLTNLVRILNLVPDGEDGERFALPPEKKE